MSEDIIDNKLIDEVIKQIANDLQDGDQTAIEEMLRRCPIDALVSFLPEDDL